MCMMTKEILLSLLGEGRQRYKYNWQKKKEKKSEKNKYNDNEREDQNVLRKWCPHDLINFKIKCEILVFDFFFSEHILLFFSFGSFLFFFFFLLRNEFKWRICKISGFLCYMCCYFIQGDARSPLPVQEGQFFK